jgi:environmental stress-induced protein Ves
MDTHAPRILLAKDRTIEPWLNGGGSATRIAVHPETATPTDFDWRISVASIEQDADFSVYPGVQRHLMPLTSHGLSLTIDGETHRLPGFESFEFGGDALVRAIDVTSGSRDLNLMVRRDSFVGSLTAQSVQGGFTVSAAPNEAVVLVLLDPAFGLGYLDAVELQPDSNLNLDGSGVIAIARITSVG